MLYRFALLVALIAISTSMASCVDLEREAAALAYREREVQPIECHVRFIDQDGKPVSLAKVKGQIWSEKPGKIRAETKDLEGISTDADGKLTITGESGGFLRLAVTDDRYLHGDTRPRAVPGVVLRYSKNSSLGSAEHGTVEKPAAYTVWRKEGPQALTGLSGELAIPYTGKSLRLDLAKGMLVDDGGDLLIEADMPATDEDRRKAADYRGIFPAKFTVKAIDGGLLDKRIDPEEYDTASGISASEFPITELSDRLIRFQGFFRLRGGQVNGKLKLDVGAEDVGHGGEGRIVIRINECLLNASGSRSLEVDQARLTTLKLTDGRQPAPAKP